jgi:hypothetical protein
MSMFNSDLSEQLAHFEAQRDEVCKALGILGAGSGVTINEAYYYLTRVLKGAVAIAPYAKGDRVELVATPEINMQDSWGWMASKHFLIEGAAATVHAIELWDKGWSVSLKFDDDSWIDQAGKVNPIAEERRSLYCFGARWIRKLPAKANP